MKGTYCHHGVHRVTKPQNNEGTGKEAQQILEQGLRHCNKLSTWQKKHQEEY